MPFSIADHEFMSRAVQLAQRGLYTTDPNPRVGCVLVRAGHVVGEGWHIRAGGPHAEIHALQMAGDRAQGATAYVSLEPCCHHGKTPPCTDALIAARVERVVIAMQDPNPKVAGKGIAQLREAGIQVETGLLSAQAQVLNPGYCKRMQTGRPLVRNKLAMSLDGRTAMADGVSKWISGEAAREDVQRWRARSSAIVTGVGTVLADDPALTVRLQDAVRQPLRVIIDTNLSTPPQARIFQQAGRTLIMTACDDEAVQAELRAAGAEIRQLPVVGNRIDLPTMLRDLAELEMNEVLLETGATLSGAMLEAGLVDELIIYMAPHLMGDAARPLFRLPQLATMQDRMELTLNDVRLFGQDLRVTATPIYK